MSEESFHSEHPGGWIEWFCGLEDHSFLCEVDEEFIQDSVNSMDFKANYVFFENAMDMILQPEMPEGNDLSDPKFLEVYQDAVDIYGLLHAKYIQTPMGLAILRERFLQGRFGECPRVYCEQQHVIPVGLSEVPKTSRVKVYCPRCEDAYVPKKKCGDMDGAYFGKTLPTLLLMTHSDIVPQKGNVRNLEYKKFEPTVFGFRVYGKTGSNYEKEILQSKNKQSHNIVDDSNEQQHSQIFKENIQAELNKLEMKPSQKLQENPISKQKKKKNQKA